MKIDEMSLAALKDSKKLKLILKGSVEPRNNEKVGVVSVIYITENSNLAKEKFEDLISNKNDDDFYMIYSCNFDTYLPDLGHYPSMEISKEDLEN